MQITTNTKLYTGPRTGKRGRPKTKDGKIDMKNLDLTRIEKMEMKLLFRHFTFG
ncbi:hypothetical protein [Segatella copri]|uniref:hypothetical protein n=1 Tax=Segatella copri TaxID=165179 RepID=UPI00222EBEFD|nr:hypothetical protein [Segatella copri]MCW4078171.1 hypothetical protein [Segatella copri]MCW4108523.1 hypothetical protein [Segatella copri]